MWENRGLYNCCWPGIDAVPILMSRDGDMRCTECTPVNYSVLPLSWLSTRSLCVIDVLSILSTQDTSGGQQPTTASPVQQSQSTAGATDTEQCMY